MKRILLFASVLAVAFTANAQDAAVDAAAAQAIVDNVNAHPKKWKTGVDVSLTASQNFVSQETSWSSAWYQGGSSSLSGLAGLKGWFNYNGYNGLMWDNLVELSYGINTTFVQDKAGRAWHLSDDKTSYSTKLGYDLGKNWYIAWNGDLNTTLFDNYITVDDDRHNCGADYALSSAAFSPLRFNTGIGVNWKYEKNGAELSIYIAPYAYKLVYVNDKRTFVAMDGDKNAKCSSISDQVGIGQTISDQEAYDALIALGNYQDACQYVVPNSLKSYNLGSRFDIQYKHHVNDNVNLYSRFQFYTNYKGIEVDWEFTADFKLFKLLTARVSVNPRYDSTVEGGWDVAKLQLKELVSLGLAYRFEK